MSDSKISDLTAATSASGTDEFVVLQSSTDKHITFTALKSSLGLPPTGAYPAQLGWLGW